MASVVWSCPEYRDPHLCSKQLLRDHVQSDDAITAKDWVTGNRNHCFICITPSQQPPILGCFCNNITRPKGLPAAMKITFSSPIVCNGASDSGTDVLEVDIQPKEEWYYYPSLGASWQTTFLPETPADRRNRVARMWTPGLEYGKFTVTYTGEWRMEVPGASYSEITVRNPLAYIDDTSEQAIARAGLNGNVCSWLFADAKYNWTYWHDAIYGIQKREWKLTRSLQWADWLIWNSAEFSGINGVHYGYLPATPPNHIPPGTSFTRVNTSPPPERLYGLGSGIAPAQWVWEKHFIKGGFYPPQYYYWFPMEEIGVLQPTMLCTGGWIDILEDASVSEGSVSLNTGNIWDLVFAFSYSSVDYAYFGFTASTVRPLGNPAEAITLRSSVNSVPDKAIGPVPNPNPYLSSPRDFRKYPVDGYASSYPYGSTGSIGTPPSQGFTSVTSLGLSVPFSNPIAPGADETYNAWWNGVGMREGWFFNLSISGRQFILSLSARFEPSKYTKFTMSKPIGASSVGSLVTSNLAVTHENPQNFGPQLGPYPYTSSSWWTKTHIDEQGDYSIYRRGDYVKTISRDTDPPHPDRRRSGTRPPTYVGAFNGEIGRWVSDVIPCGKIGVIELRLQRQITPPALGPNQKQVGPTRLPLIAYLDIGDSGVQ